MDIVTMDINILFSMINMKLRDKYNDLEDLCYDMDIKEEELINKFNKEGYKYSKEQNQFKLI